MIKITNVLFLICFLAPTTPSKAQEYGLIKGKVGDKSSHRPLINVNIVLAKISLGTVTDRHGNFEIKFVPPGTYKVIATHIGYRPESLDVFVKQGMRLHLEILLTKYPIPRKEITIEALPSLREAVEDKIVIQRDQIRMHAGGFGEDMFNLIQNLPGVMRPNEESGVFVVNGGEPDENAILLSGVKLLHPYHLLGFIGIINDDIIKKVSFYRAGLPLEYGDALSSVVDVVPKDFEKSEGSWKYDPANIAIAYGAPVTKKTNFVASIRKTYYQIRLGPLSYKDMPVNYYDIFGKFVWSPSYRHKVTFNLIRGVDYTGSLCESGNLFSTIWSTLIIKNVTSTLTLYETTHDISGSWQSNSLSDSHEDFGFKERFSLKLGDELELSGGIEAVRSLYSTKVINRRTTSLGSYMDCTFTPMPLLVLNFGTRYDWLGWTKDGEINPGIIAKIRLTEKLTLRGGYRRTSQCPYKFIQNPYFSIYVQEQDVLTPPDQLLEAKLANHYFLETDLRLQNIYFLKASLYKKIYSNLPTWQYVSASQCTSYSNSGYGYVQGLEFFVEKRDTHGASGWLSYALSICKKRKGMEETLIYDDFDQRHLFNLCLTVPFGHNCILSTTFRFGSGHPYTPTTITKDVGVIYGERNSRRLPSYHRLDMRIEKHFPKKPLKPYLYVKILNLYNRQNVFRYVEYEYEEDKFINCPTTGLPITPLAGIGGCF